MFFLDDIINLICPIIGGVQLKAVGLVVEYNPFHYGHLHHLKMAQSISGANIVIAVMSGNFLQRGEPALVSKWSRTNMALQAGVDIVVELPYQFATQKADTFAFGAIATLNLLHCNYICFGSEAGQIDTFHNTVDFVTKNKSQLNSAIKSEMNAGTNYPQAVANAFSKIATNEQLLDLSQPNNMLGFQYIASLKKLHSPMTALTIKRKSANYHDDKLALNKITSATSIRKTLFNNDNSISTIKNYVPNSTYNELENYKNEFGLFHNWELYWPLLQYKLITFTNEQLHDIYEMEEGLENRFKTAAYKCSSFNDFIKTIKTKRYTWTRLQRAAVHLLTNTTKREMQTKHEQVTYIRLLGFTNQGRKYLNFIKNKLSVPLVSNLAANRHEQVSLDIKGANTYALGLDNDIRLKLLEKEFKQPPIYLK